MKTIFITGASSGIGKATARHFAEKGWNVIATMRSPEKETELTGLDNVLILRLDVEQKETIQESIVKGIKRFGKIDVLLNNAGYGTMGIFESATDEQIRRQFDVNVFGLMKMTKAMLPHLRANKNGLIINISSMGGKITFPTMSLYHATKFAVEGFTESLSFELASQNIHVKLIEPGSINTDFSGRSMDFFFDESLTDYHEYTDSFRNGLKKMSERGQFTSPEIVAEVIYQAATDSTNQMRYVIGEDAKNLIKIKEESGDLAFIKHMTQMFL
ncbi:SDR family oxidoreductase [Bacillus cereus]